MIFDVTYYMGLRHAMTFYFECEGLPNEVVYILHYPNNLVKHYSQMKKPIARIHSIVWFKIITLAIASNVTNSIYIAQY
jgi:hypothetical protein